MTCETRENPDSETIRYLRTPNKSIPIRNRQHVKDHPCYFHFGAQDLEDIKKEMGSLHTTGLLCAQKEYTGTKGFPRGSS